MLISMKTIQLKKTPPPDSGFSLSLREEDGMAVLSVYSRDLVIRVPLGTRDLANLAHFHHHCVAWALGERADLPARVHGGHYVQDAEAGQ